MKTFMSKRPKCCCVFITSFQQVSVSGLLDGRVVEAAFGDGSQDVLQVGNVSHNGVDVLVDGDKPVTHSSLQILHVPKPRLQIKLHFSLSAGQRVLQLLHMLFIHNTWLV